MPRLFSALFVLSVLSVTAPAFATPQDWSDPIATDRPDFTESAYVVPEGMTQVETGLTYQRLQDSNETAVPETLIRHAVVRNFELRLGTPTWNITRSRGNTSTAFNDVYAGFKYGFERSLSRYFDASIIPAVFIPTGDDGSSSYTPEVKFCTASELTDTFSLSAMAYLRSDASEGSREQIYQQTFSLGAGLSDQWASFYEYIFETYNDGPFTSIIHGGLIYLVTPDVQLDMHLGRTVSSGYGEPFIAAGLSFRM
jgi:hypothetical protein